MTHRPRTGSVDVGAMALEDEVGFGAKLRTVRLTPPLVSSDRFGSTQRLTLSTRAQSQYAELGIESSRISSNRGRSDHIYCWPGKNWRSGRRVLERDDCAALSFGS
jgi:hypothetical protein